MSVWLTPQLAPFVGGTYFPPEDRFGHPAFKRVLQRIAEAWKNDGAKISSQGANIVDALREAAKDQTSAGKIDAVDFGVGVPTICAKILMGTKAVSVAPQNSRARPR